MDNVKILEVKQSIFASNDEQAAALRAELKQEKIFLLNLMSAPGSGKTTTLRRTIAALQNELRIGVMEADIDSDVDARAIAETGAKERDDSVGSRGSRQAAEISADVPGLRRRARQQNRRAAVL